MMEDFDELEFNPPSAQRVAARALALAAMVCRSSLEADAGNTNAESVRGDVVAWIESVGVDAELEDPERTFLRAPLGTLPRQAVINASWQGEGMAVLAWALGRADLPPTNAIVDSPTVGDQLGFLADAETSLLASPILRPASELEGFREKLFALHWRLREFSLTRESLDFRRIAREANFGPLDVATLSFIGNDLAIDGRSLLDVPESRWRECLSIASERHKAANWLAGYEVIYSDVTADT